MSEPVRVPNPALERMRAGGVALGMTVRMGHSGDIVRLAKTTGHDFIFIDGQHSLFNLETIGHMAQVALGCGVWLGGAVGLAFAAGLAGSPAESTRVGLPVTLGGTDACPQAASSAANTINSRKRRDFISKIILD